MGFCSGYIRKIKEEENERILIQPKENYQCANHSLKPLNKNKVYSAELATNQPEYIEKGLVFCDGYLLEKNEYTIK